VKRPQGARRRNAGRARPTIQRTRPLRRTQLISPFGIGAITDFRNDEALMCAGLDAWFTGGGGAPPEDLKFREERRQQRLGVQFFVRPPEFSVSEGGPRIRVPHVRFPQWHYCPRCFRMSRATLYGDQPRCDNPACASGRYQRRMIPVPHRVGVRGRAHTGLPVPALGRVPRERRLTLRPAFQGGPELGEPSRHQD
jgi:hypothetical protein